MVDLDIQCLADSLRTYRHSAQCVLLAYSGESVINNAWIEQYEVVIRAWVNILTVMLADFVALCSGNVLRWARLTLLKDPMAGSHYSYELS
jgi:hypothetical protein